MKVNLQNTPKISVIFISILFITNILSSAVPLFGDLLLLYPSRLNNPLNWYQFLTYPLYVGGLLSWLINSIIIITTGFVIESRLKQKEVITIIVVSSILGGLGFTIMGFNDIGNISLASPVMISWGYWSATLVIAFLYWKEFNLFEKIVTWLCILSVFGILDTYVGLTLGKLIIVLVITTLTFIRVKRKINAA